MQFKMQCAQLNEFRGLVHVSGFRQIIIIIIIKYGCLLRTVPKEILDSLCTTVLRYLKKLSEQLNLKRIS